MITTYNISDIKFEATVVTIGFFDGVHLGHCALINQLKHVATKEHAQTVVITFWPHPRNIIRPHHPLELLNTFEEKKLKLEQLGVDYLVVIPFTEAFSRLSAREFLTQFVAPLPQVKQMLLGHDHRFGHDQQHDIQSYQTIGKSLGIEIFQHNAFRFEGKVISSSLIRQCLTTAQIDLANAYLNYSYQLQGTVVRGKQIGTQLGYPTANLHPEPQKIIPQTGVYAVRVNVDTVLYGGMLNIGFRPTIKTKQHAALSIEVHLFNFHEDLYGKKLTVSFEGRIRSEQSFHSMQELKSQLEKDELSAREMLNS